MHLIVHDFFNKFVMLLLSIFHRQWKYRYTNIQVYRYAGIQVCLIIAYIRYLCQYLMTKATLHNLLLLKSMAAHQYCKLMNRAFDSRLATVTATV